MVFAQWPVLQPLPLAVQLKPLSSAKTKLTRLPNGVLELTIKHDLIRGVTREMLAWWFAHIDDTMEYEGQILPRYRVWHPKDHIFYRDLTRDSQGAGGAGTRRHIVEAFGGNPQFLVNVIDRVVKLDETGILLATEKAGMNLGPLGVPLLPLGAEISTLQHDFIVAPGGVRYESRMLVGSDTLTGRLLLNRIVSRIMPEPMGRAWLRHNIEEVGNFERFLPGLWRSQ